MVGAASTTGRGAPRYFGTWAPTRDASTVWQYSTSRFTAPRAVDPRLGNTGVNALLKDRPLKFGEDAEHLKQRPACGRSRIDGLAIEIEVTPGAVEFAGKAGSERPSRSTDQAATTSILRRVAALSSRSKPGRLSRLLAREHPRGSSSGQRPYPVPSGVMRVSRCLWTCARPP